MQHLFLFILGLCFGSFANVYFYRLPKELSLITPNSFCPNCNSLILWKDNIPILSWIFLKAKCRSCAEPISIRYPAVELLCGIIFFTVSFYFKDCSLPVMGALLLFSYLLFLASGIDMVTYFQSEKEYGIIPNHLVWTLALSGLLFSPWNPLLKPLLEFPFPTIDFPGIANEMKQSLLSKSENEIETVHSLSLAMTSSKKILVSLLGGALAFLFLFGTRQIATQLFRKEALGLGDVKLVCAVGLWLGWQGVFLTVLFSSLLGSLLSLSLILSKKLSRGSSLPFAPFLSLGAFLSLFFL